jgi:uncharacterized small protein (DUF1192 family)
MTVMVVGSIEVSAPPFEHKAQRDAMLDMRSRSGRMHLEDIEPKKAKAHELGTDLSKLSIGELAALVEALKAEIARVEAIIAAKQCSKSAADAAFRR